MTRSPWLRFAEPEQVTDYVASAEAAGHNITRLQGSELTTLDEVFNSYAREFRFPDYFGHNYPAFDECLVDLDWLRAPGYLTVISDGHRVLEAEPAERPTFRRCLERVGDNWDRAFGLRATERGGAVTFRTILVVDATQSAW